MREIKFRLWNRAAKRFHYDVENVFECLIQQIRFNKSMPSRFHGIEYDFISEGFEWNQFTSLTDKNGKEIYEGDIIAMTGGLILNIGYPSKGEIIFNIHSASFVMRGLNINNVYMNMSLGFSDGTEIEVIGNIYEHPELLK